MSNPVIDVKSTLHISDTDVPWIESAPGFEFRILQARLDDPLVVNELRAQPGVESPLHRHDTPVLAWTIEGAWGHDRRYLYRPGTYVYETPGVVHRFLNGPEVTVALFIQTGDLVNLEDGDTGVLKTLAQRVSWYFEACETAGLPRPNVLLD